MLGSLKFNSAKCETTCRLCLGRIKLLKNKRNMQMKAYRKDVADLLRAGKQDYARIRVEAVIREGLTLTAFEILELYLELLAVRAGLVANSKEIPRDMVEALSSVLYAASRVPDLPELVTLHKMFGAKYGKEYVTEACSDVSCHRWMVNESLRRCLTIEPPEAAVKLETLSEIAQEYGVEWDMDRARREMLPDHEGAGLLAAGGGGGASGLVYSNPHAAPAAAAPAAAAPPTQQQHQQQQQQLQPATYADAAAAAAAAAVAAGQARSAAEAAARLAAGAGAGSGSSGVGSPSKRGGASGGGTGVFAPAAGAPPQGWLAGMEGFQQHQEQQQQQQQQGSPVKGGDTGSLQMHPLPGSSGSSARAGAAGAGAADAGAGAGPTGYRVPSAEEIQRAYDAATGPPAKPETAAAGGAARPGDVVGHMAPPPAAPPVIASEADVAAYGAAAGSGGGSVGGGVSDGGGDAGGVGGGDVDMEDDAAGLPGVPGSSGGDAAAGVASGGGASAASSSAVSEYDELQKRFEALKKS